MKHILYLFFFLFNGSLGFAQTDSLKQLLIHSTGENRIEILNELAWVLSYTEGELSLVYAKEALELSVKLENKIGEATSHARIGLVYDYQARWDKALDHYQKSLKLRIIIGERIPISNAWNNIGAVYYYTGKYEKAIEAHINSLRIRESIMIKTELPEHKKLVSQSLNNIAIINRITGDYDQAIKNYKQSLEIKENLNDFKGQVVTLSNLGVVYQTKEQFQEALDFFIHSYQLANEHKIVSELSAALNNMGLTYKALKYYKLAEEKLEESLAITQEYSDNQGSAVAYVNLAGLYFDQQKYELSIFTAKKCYQLADSIHFSEGMKSALQQMTASHKAMGNFEQALQYYQDFVLLKDSLLNENSSKKILELSAKYDAVSKENKIDMLNAQSKLDQSKLAQRNALAAALGVGFLLVCVVSFFMIRNYRTRKLAAEANTRRAIQKHLKEIDLLRANIQNQLDQTEKFKVGISKTELNTYLLNPLSDRELEVMFLLADGKSNQDIANELFVSINTVKTHVLRIYEKLDVKNRTQAAVKAGNMNILNPA
ncbi:MAG: tetratricopeptide repeat protein [Crocinitomicaceae bacterium]|nr:tetratricopeptide repeat protein [Flavobacteriales bacterium]NQZ36796.1 tetratricopeptide repeat protein [Crocinitomicaceae bacterium]